MKVGIVALIGRPNAGKSTLLNNLLGHKVSITSPKPQTTRFNIQAVYEEDRGQIVFVDTPGIFSKVEDSLARKINLRAEEGVQNIDVIVYLVDHTRKRDVEENRALGIVRKVKAPKLLVINKIDVRDPSYLVQYKFMEEEFDKTIHLSAFTGKNIPQLLDAVFELLPERAEPLVDTKTIPQPGINLDSKTFISEIIREKAFLFLRREVPYTLTSVVDEVIERDNGALYIKARILTSADRYKSMIIGKSGVMIKEISQASRKELETASNKKVFLELTVETDPHWVDYV